MTITLEMIRGQCAYPSAWNRGRLLYLQNGVRDFTCQLLEGECSARAQVQGSRLYDVSATLQETSKGLEWNFACACESSEKEEGPCQHCVALLLRVREYLLEQSVSNGTYSLPQTQSSGSMKRILNHYAKQSQYRHLPSAAQQVQLEPVLSFRYADGYSGYPRLEMRMGQQRMYVLKSIPQFMQDYQQHREVSCGKQLRFVPDTAAFTEESRLLLPLLEELVRSTPAASSFSLREGDPRYLPLNSVFFGSLMETCVGKQIASDKGMLSVIAENPPLEILLQAVPEGGLVLRFSEFLYYRGKEHLYVLLENVFYQCDLEFSQDMEAFLQELLSAKRGAWLSGRTTDPVYYLSPQDYPVFCTHVLPLLERYLRVQSEIDLEAYRLKEPRFLFYLDWEDEVVSCSAEVHYGDLVYNLLGPIDLWKEVRDYAREAEIVDVLEELFTREEGADTLIARDDAAYFLFFEGVERLRERGEVYLSETWKNIHLHRSGHVTAGVSLSAGMLRLTWEVEGMDAQEVEEILQAYRVKKRFYRLRKGDVIRIQESGFAFLAELSDALRLPDFAWQSGQADVPLYRASQVNALLDERGEGVSVVCSSDFREMIGNLQRRDEKDIPVPNSLQAQLWPYQEVGFRWLCMLTEYGFGGILADDMGLGKTVQMIALLTAYPGLSCIVCPASLVYNWESEIHRFAPHFETVVLSGNREERQQQMGCLPKEGVLITSYDALKRDVDLHAGICYRFLVLDEAQSIKNPGTLAAQSVKLLSAEHRFALTGTPLENRLSDLWSLFDFLMPGYLYSYRVFRTELELPLVNEKDPLALARLQRMIRPFILRRRKKDVLAELPEKVETVFYAGMSAEQDQLYRANLARLQQRVRASSQEGFRQARFEILAELTKLRQLCCDPSLLYQDYRGGSGKLDTGVELLQNAVDEGHRILVFSQFTSMLDVLCRRMQTLGIPYLLLTGKDGQVKRKTTVDAFQQGVAPIFFLSLKAGGTGLNLTAADMVLHFDPWWNVAAENQATDRAHRIGQSHPVTVIKLVTKDSIEERILDLQERKSQLLETVIAEPGLSDGRFSREELLTLLEG